jgi:HEPN domain-containing protein
MRPETKWWLESGGRDLEMAQKLLDGGFYEGCAFHAQQAAEKQLKALLLEKGYALRTHSNVALLEESKRLGLPVTSELEHCARKLDSHYISARYPNGVGGSPQSFFDEIIAREAIACAEKLMEFIRSNMP